MPGAGAEAGGLEGQQERGPGGCRQGGWARQAEGRGRLPGAGVEESPRLDRGVPLCPTLSWGQYVRNSIEQSERSGRPTDSWLFCPFFVCESEMCVECRGSVVTCLVKDKSLVLR